MSIKGNIQKLIFICIWLLVGTGLVVLLVAAVNARNHQVCNGYEIRISGDAEDQGFIDKNDIAIILTGNKTVAVKNKPIRSFDLNLIESRLKREPWIKDAQLFFDNNGILKVIVKEREPVARIFASSGESFYMDSTGQKLPLSGKISARLPVFTGFPSDMKKTKSASDRKLIRQIKELSIFLLKDPFWMAQISQVEITPSREFEMVPTIGNHLIEFGDGKDYESKFKRLFVFYKQVLSKTGMEKYERIKVQYDKQIVGVKKENNNN